MDAMPSEPSPRRRRRAAKPPNRQEAERVRRQIRLSAEADLRLVVHAHRDGVSVTTFLERLILAHCRRFVVSDRGGEPAADSPGQDEP
jgi:hypothetical protein